MSNLSFSSELPLVGEAENKPEGSWKYLRSALNVGCESNSVGGTCAEAHKPADEAGGGREGAGTDAVGGAAPGT